MLQIQTACLTCGMIATYEGTKAKSLISVEALKKVEDDALAVGLAPRAAIATSTPALAQPVVEAEEEMENLTELEANEKLMARIFGIQRFHSVDLNEGHHGKGRVQKHKAPPGLESLAAESSGWHIRGRPRRSLYGAYQTVRRCWVSPILDAEGCWTGLGAG